MTDSIVFVVRLWRGTGFRAVVRRVDEEQTLLFEVPAALTRFFVERSRPAGTAGTSTPDPDSWRTP
jgi:hypothetical protein